MQDRLYQETHVDQTVSAIEKYRCVISQMPTGGGKTHEFCLIIKKLLRNHIDIEKGPVLILVHRIELLHQAARTVKEILGFDPCLITSETDRYWISRVYVGMVQSTMNRLDMFINPSLIIVDEAHLQDFIKVHKHFQNTKILGWTATPLSVSKKDPLRNYYQKIVVGPQIKELIEQKYLSQNFTWAPDNGGVDTSKFEYDKLTGDYNQRQLVQTYSMRDNVENVIHKYWERCLKKKTLVFNVSIETSKEVCRFFNAVGIPCKHLDSNSPDRAEILKWFKETEYGVLCSVMIPTMGFDEPTVEAIILNYSTLSLVKYIQTVGRGSRIIDQYFIDQRQHEYPYPLKLKSTFIVLDLGLNWKNFGDWSDDRDWERIFYYPDLAGSGIAPMKTCKSCGALVHAAVRVCPVCETPFPKKKSEQIDMEEMILITKGIDINAMSENAEKRYKYYPFFEMAVDIVHDMMAMHGKNPSQNTVDKYFRQYYDRCVKWYEKSIALNPEEIGDIRNSTWHINKAKNNFNSLIKHNNKDSLLVGNNAKDVIHPEYPDNVKEREKQWELTKSTLI